MMSLIAQRRVARALRAGGPEVIEVGDEELAPLKAGEVLVRVEAAGLNHAETLIRSGTYTVRLPFPYAVGGEGRCVPGGRRAHGRGPRSRLPSERAHSRGVGCRWRGRSNAGGHP